MNRYFDISVNNLIVLFLMILLISAGCGSGGPDSKEKSASGMIQGRLTASSRISFKTLKTAFQETITGTVGVPGAVCTLEGNDKSATTDENGFFQISDVASGSYIIICKKTTTDGKVYAFLNIVEVQPDKITDLGTIEITQTGSIQGTATLADRTDHTGITAYIPGTSLQAKTDALGAYLINNVPVGTYEVRFEKSGYVPAILTYIIVTSGESILSDTVILNLSTGATGSIWIEDGRTYSNSRTVTVSINASADAVLYQMSENPNFIGAVWNPIPPSRTWIFDSDGEKRLYIKFADANGLESAPVSDSIIIDITPPANGRVIINNGASATNSPTVTLNLSATDATTIVSQAMISNDPGFNDAQWESFSNTRSWTFSTGDGTKTVYVKFKDLVGNETPAVSASIILDTGMPILPSISIQEGEFTNNPTIHLSLSASGATLMKLSENPEFTGVSSIPFTSETSWNLTSINGSKTIYIIYLDDAGNQTDPVSDSIVLDTIRPTTPIIFNQNQTTNQPTFEMTLSTASTDANFANYQLKGGQYPDWTDTTETEAFSFTLTQEGSDTLSIRGIDLVGNISNPASVTINLDTVKPVLSNINVSAAIPPVTISWDTSEPTSGRVDYGLNEDYGSTAEDSTITTSHKIILSDLSPLTLYHYKITVIDMGDNITESTDLTFMTGRTLVGNLQDIGEIAIDDTFLYFVWSLAGDGRIAKVPKNGGSVTTLMSGIKSGSTPPIAVDDSFIFFRNCGNDYCTNGSLNMIPKEGGAVTVLATGLKD